MKAIVTTYKKIENQDIIAGHRLILRDNWVAKIRTLNEFIAFKNKYNLDAKLICADLFSPRIQIESLLTDIFEGEIEDGIIVHIRFLF